MKRGGLRILMAGALLLVALNGLVAWRALHSLYTAQAWLSHTTDTLTTTQEVIIGMSSANSAARAFLLTAEPPLDRRYHQDVMAAMAAVDHLQSLTTDNPSQQARIAILRQRIAVRLAAVDIAMGQRRQDPNRLVNRNLVEASLSENPGGGISPRYALEQIGNEERRLLRDRTASSGAARRRASFTLLGASLLDVVLLLLAFRLLARTAEDRHTLAERAEEILALNRDLTVLNAELESRVAQRTRELEASNQELQAFSYSVSHDLRAPLRTIDGFSLALEEDFADLLNDEGRDYIRRVRSGVQRMGMLIDALLQLSRVTRSEVQRESVNLSQLATLIFEELRVNEPEREVRFVAQPDLLAEADPRLMRVAFENLIGNALKFTSKVAQAQIALGQTEREGQNVYFIRDNGAGFDMQYVDRLFTAFQRLHGDRDFKGSGIGLATVSRIIRRHSGEIWAQGEIGVGATFFFTISAHGPAATDLETAK